LTILTTEDGAPVRATNRLPVELYGPTGQPLFPTPRLAADNLALPTAPDVLAIRITPTFCVPTVTIPAGNGVLSPTAR